MEATRKRQLRRPPTDEEKEAILSRATCSVDEAAWVLGVGRAQGYKAAHNGQLKSIRIAGRVLVPTAALRELLDGAHSAA
jgi:excisionase family DNA binding protein